MWARICEIFLACWLGLSPFIFRFWGLDPDQVFLRVNGLLCAAGILFFSLLSCYMRIQ